MTRPRTLRNSPRVSAVKPASHRMTLTLPAELSEGLRRLAQHMGISTSALVTALLSEAVPDLESLLALAPTDPDDQTAAKRFRGKSIDLVMDAVATALKEL